MRKIFIDTGAYNGDSIEIFLRDVSDAKEYEIFAFEPNPQCWPDERLKACTLIKKAVWIKDGWVDFYIDNENGSTILKDKVTGDIDYENPIKVACVDLSKWIKKNFDKDDRIILKMDIEGAEYQILYKMLKDKTTEYLNELWVEFHPNKVLSITTTENNELIARLSMLPLLFKEWLN